jgi:hypothetical protein
MAIMVEERLNDLLSQRGGIAQPERGWIILLGLINTFLDEDVSEREIRPLFEKSLRKIEEMALRGIPFLLFQPTVFPESKRIYLMRRLFQFANEAWRIDLDDEGPKMILEKGARMVSHCERSEAILEDRFVALKLRDSS